MTLKDYKRKRDFNKTTEPEGQINKEQVELFVIQKHDASRLHLDYK